MMSNIYEADPTDPGSEWGPRPAGWPESLPWPPVFGGGGGESPFPKIPIPKPGPGPTPPTIPPVCPPGYVTAEQHAADVAAAKQRGWWLLGGGVAGGLVLGGLVGYLAAR
jgi:hypothetical protein